MDEPLLTLEGALGPFSVALVRGDLKLARSVNGQAALERGITVISELLSEAGIELRELGGLAVGIGPGSFTGLRIAISYAKSLALGAKVPLAGVSSFDIVDAAAGAEDRLPRLTIVQGRTGVACVRRVDRDGEAVACGPTGQALEKLLRDDRELTVVGATEDVMRALGERGTSVHRLSAQPEIPALTLARIARDRAPATSPHAVAPEYGEQPAAKIRESR